ncbi:hypothetical protein OYC64_005214 [Pagothenia borchgrevinki]|uniref:Neuroblastoma-amplified sequence N-terminal domain-containing protein n=1 Tax=Pagothenia borchgrevinki TaxID=8213 RepID=A0ABD2GFW8_PAGBO
MAGRDRHSGPFRLVLHYLWYSNGKLLAVVQDQCVEIRSVRDDFGSIIGKCQGFDEINPEWKTSLERRKKIEDKEQYYPLEDVSWWSDMVLILARCSGSVTVSSIRTLRNLLGKSCEWFEPSPRVTAAHEVVFLSLEVRVQREEPPFTTSTDNTFFTSAQ